MKKISYIIVLTVGILFMSGVSAIGENCSSTIRCYKINSYGSVDDFNPVGEYATSTCLNSQTWGPLATHCTVLRPVKCANNTCAICDTMTCWGTATCINSCYNYKGEKIYQAMGML